MFGARVLYFVSFSLSPCWSATADVAKVPPAIPQEQASLLVEGGRQLSPNDSSSTLIVPHEDGNTTVTSSTDETGSSPPWEEEPASGCSLPGSLCDTVMRLEAIYSFVNSIAKEHQSFVKLDKLGLSFEGRPVYALTIHDHSKPFSTIMVEFGIHAREWASTASAVRFIEQLIKKKGVLISAIRWIIIPLLNPDGYEYSVTVDNMWRKNRRVVKAGEQCGSVDLNRNFITGWQEKPLDDWCEEDYPGTGPLSEPEAKLLRKYVESIGPSNIDAYVAVHSCAQSMLYPYGYTDRKIEEKQLKKHLEVARKMAKAMNKVRNLNYTVQQASELGAAGGGSDDFMFEYFKIPIVFTMELGDDSYFQVDDYHHCFHPPTPQNMDHLTNESNAGLIELAAYLQPRVAFVAHSSSRIKIPSAATKKYRSNTGMASSLLPFNVQIVVLLLAEFF